MHSLLEGAKVRFFKELMVTKRISSNVTVEGLVGGTVSPWLSLVAVACDVLVS
jgi:predicted CDP-diglyceride synthetase/phosphatidate cytidylyltransferase